MNTKIYKRVHTLAGDLVRAAQKQDESSFLSLYAQLKELCEEHESTEKDHPVQWETLADFTEDSTEALRIYEKASGLAEAIESHDFLASINYAIACIYQQLERPVDAINHANQALKSVPKIEDASLQNDIKTLVAELSRPKPQPNNIWKS